MHEHSQPNAPQPTSAPQQALPTGNPMQVGSPNTPQSRPFTAEVESPNSLEASPRTTHAHPFATPLPPHPPSAEGDPANNASTLQRSASTKLDLTKINLFPSPATITTLQLQPLPPSPLAAGTSFLRQTTGADQENIGFRGGIQRSYTQSVPVPHLRITSLAQAGSIQLSPLSDQLQTVWITQGKGAFFEQLRNLTTPPDADVHAFVRNTLTGDDLWLAQNLLTHGREANWPIHLRVEREMKGWGDSGGKGVVFDILRTANGAQASNVDLMTTLNRVFGAGTDDLWLAQNLQTYGREAGWPIHLRVEREMKGWSDSGGKGVVFDILRTANGAEAGNAQLIASVSRVFGAGTDDLWLAQNLQAHGLEARWPIHLRVEREMKGWGDSGGKGVVFDILRTANGAEASNAQLIASVSRVFGAGTDDLWLAQNLQTHGLEARWPIHLRVEREMKGWGDSGGKGAVFDILRAANGAQAGNADLIAVLSRVFAADTEDAFLAENLRTYGPEASWPVPGIAPSGDIPFDRNPLSAPGERIIFNEEFTYPLAHNFHQLVYTASGGGFDAAGGATTKTIRGLVSGNVDFFIDAAWTGAPAATVRCEVQCRSNNHVADTLNWTFGKKTTTPTTMTQVEGEGERPLGSTYSYQLGPDIGAPGAPDYEHQTILERFEQRTCNIVLDDLKQEFKDAHPAITTPAQITAHFFGTSSSNGTFTIDNLDQVYDVHNGGMPNQSVFQAALKPAKLTSDIYVDLPQVYEVQPGVALARYTVRRILKPDGSKVLRKIRVP